MVWKFRAAVILACGLPSLPAANASAARPEMPFESSWVHVGVATCAGSTCHSAQQPFADAPIRQDEYLLWQRKDAHSNAYKALHSPAGKRIAVNLGIADATQAPECLTCHTDYVALAQRGKRYAMSDGVGCEACHGGAKDWLGPHVSGNTHAQNLAAGLYPLEDPVARGRLCLQCHLGTEAKPIDHRIMGAGHPPLDFELDTFTQIQPAHFQADADYRKRKRYRDGAQTWAIGQLLAAEMFIEGVTTPRFESRGLFPELVFFDCDACHHPMRPVRWNPGIADPLGPGQPRMADAYLVTSGILLGVLAPETAREWNTALAQLHVASNRSVDETKQVAVTLRRMAGDALEKLRDRKLSKAEAVSLIERLAQTGVERQAGSYATTRQIFYGVESLLSHLRQEHGITDPALKRASDELFAAVDAQREYDPEAARAALRKLRGALANASRS